MFAKKIEILLVFVLLATAASASDGGIVAVLEVVVSEDTDGESESLELTIQQTRFLTDELRKQATMTLGKTYAVLNRAKIIALSESVPDNVTTVVDIGRAIKSDYVTSSFLSYLGGSLIFTVELYSCESGLLLADFVKTAPDLKSLIDIVHENAPTLFKKIKPPEPAATTAVEVVNVPAPIPTNIPQPETQVKSTNWLAIGLELAGVGAIGFGLSQFAAGNNYYDKYKNRDYFKSERETAYENAKSAKTFSTISYIAGGVLLASGITIHILF